MTQKILDLIPDALKEDLINEVKDLLKSKGVEIKDPAEQKTDAEKKKAIESDIEAWANKGKTK